MKTTTYTFSLTKQQQTRLSHLSNGTLIVYNHLLLFGFKQWKKEGKELTFALLSQELGEMRIRQSWLSDIPLSLLEEEVKEAYRFLEAYRKKKPNPSMPPRIKQGKPRMLCITPICRQLGTMLLVQSLGCFELKTALRPPLESVMLQWEGGSAMMLSITEPS